METRKANICWNVREIYTSARVGEMMGLYLQLRGKRLRGARERIAKERCMNIFIEEKRGVKSSIVSEKRLTGNIYGRYW